MRAGVQTNPVSSRLACGAGPAREAHCSMLMSLAPCVGLAIAEEGLEALAGFALDGEIVGAAEGFAAMLGG